jgi:protein SCO1/2
VRAAIEWRAIARLALSALALAGFGCERTAEVPVWGALPPFRLVDQSAAPFGSEQLAGRSWIADFIFTRCPGRCPMLTREMVDLQAELLARGWRDVALVSISVDPEHDTPERLAEYAAKHGARPSAWRFLTGEREGIWTLSVDGFKLPVQAIEDTGEGPILHSNHFVLVDGRARLRGYYDAFDAQARDRLLRDLEAVRAEAQ